MSEWNWSATDNNGAPVKVADLEVPFPTRVDAEAWMSESWAELLEAGAENVSLYENETLVYGPMSLRKE